MSVWATLVGEYLAMLIASDLFSSSRPTSVSFLLLVANGQNLFLTGVWASLQVRLFPCFARVALNDVAFAVPSTRVGLSPSLLPSAPARPELRPTLAAPCSVTNSNATVTALNVSAQIATNSSAGFSSRSPVWSWRQSACCSPPSLWCAAPS